MNLPNLSSFSSPLLCLLVFVFLHFPFFLSSRNSLSTNFQRFSPSLQLPSLSTNLIFIFLSAQIPFLESSENFLSLNFSFKAQFFLSLSLSLSRVLRSCNSIFPLFPLTIFCRAFLSFKSRLKEFQVIKGWKETSRYLIRSLLNRSLRSLPAVGGCYLCLLAFPKSWGSGPLFGSSYDLVISNCLKNWPYELLFAQNTLHPSDMVCSLSNFFSFFLYFSFFYFFIFFYFIFPSNFQLSNFFLFQNFES